MEKLSDKEWLALRRYSTAPLSEVWRDAIDIVLLQRPVSYIGLEHENAMLRAQIKQLEDSRFALAVAHTEDVLTIERLAKEGR